MPALDVTNSVTLSIYYTLLYSREIISTVYNCWKKKMKLYIKKMTHNVCGYIIINAIIVVIIIILIEFNAAI